MRDRDVRAAVLKMLEIEHNGDEHTRIVQEMGVWSGSVRIDVAVINGELSGFELKSDSDTLERLPLQADIYSKVFDKMILVVGSRHIEKARDYIPPWWGILVATQTQNDAEVVLQAYRQGFTNPEPDPYLVAQLLWKDEALAVLDIYGLARGWRAKKVKAIHQRLAQELPFNALADNVRETLKNREQWLRQVMSCHLDMPINSNPNPML